MDMTVLPEPLDKNCGRAPVRFRKNPEFCGNEGGVIDPYRILRNDLLLNELW